MSFLFEQDRTGASAKPAFDSPSVEPVRVIHVIDDDKHPLYEKLGNNESNIGSILYRPLSSNIDTTEEGDMAYSGQAFPLNFNQYLLPLKNEVVLLIKGPDQQVGDSGDTDIKYYQTVYSIFNHPHINAYPVFDDPGAAVNIGEGLDYVEKIAPLQHYPGDFIIQGRLGQSIRLSGGSGSYNSYTDTENKNRPFTFITNGRNIEDSNDGFTFTNEDINKDDASIYLTSDHTIKLNLANEKRDSYDDIPDLPSKYRGNQILLNSGRLTFNANKDDILLSSANSIGINSNSVNIDSKDYLCIDSEKIYLGKKARSISGYGKQPVLKGHEVERYLQRVLDVVIRMAKDMSVASNGGGPVPSINAGGSFAMTQLIKMKGEIGPTQKSQLKSEKTFVE